MNDIKDFLKSFFSTASDRMRNPFYGTFIISWIAFNWKPLLLLLFSTKSIEEKINFVVENYASHFYNFTGPFFISILFLVIPNYILWGADHLLSWSLKGRRKIQNIRIIEDFGFRIEMATKEAELEETKANFRTIQELNSKIDLLNIQLDESSKTINNQRIELQNISGKAIFNITGREELDITKQTSNAIVSHVISEIFSKKLIEDFMKFGNDILLYQSSTKLENNPHLLTLLKDFSIVERVESSYSNRSFIFTDLGLVVWEGFLKQLESNKSQI